MGQENYYELIMDLIDFYNKGQVQKGVIDCIPKEDIQKARRWAYQKHKYRDNPNFDLLENDFDKDEWEWPII